MTPGPDRQLSAHYGLDAFLVDPSFPDLAASLTPDDEVIANLRRLAALLERVQAAFPGEWEIVSGYRDHQLNDAHRAAGMPASVNSLHLLGCAADVRPKDPGVELEAVFEWINAQPKEELPVHEAVYYPLKGVIHLAVAHDAVPGARRILMRT